MFNAHECKIVFSAVRPVIIEMGNLPVLLRQVAFEMKTQRASATALVKSRDLELSRLNFRASRHWPSRG